jgi:outer membrane protein assembly factor BamE
VVRDHKALGLRYGLLALLYFGVVELFHSAAIETDHVVMVLPFIELVDGLAGFEVVAAEDPGLLELRQHSVYSGQADVGVLVEQLSKHILRSHVTLTTAMKNIKDFQSGTCGFEPIAFEFFDLDHGIAGFLSLAAEFESSRYNDPNHIGVPANMTALRTFCYFGAWLAIGTLSSGVAGCGSFQNPWNQDTLKPYVPEVVQGNVVSKEQRQALRIGMPRAQVRDVLGTPLVSSLFHADRWDYAFSIKRQGVPEQKFRLTVTFRNDALADIEGDELPSEAEFVKRLSGSRAPARVPTLQATEEQLSKFPPGRPAAAVQAAPALPASYPPLEAPVR